MGHEPDFIGLLEEALEVLNELYEDAGVKEVGDLIDRIIEALEELPE